MVVRTVPGSVVREASKNGGMGNQHSLKVGSTDLKTLFPEVAAEADGWDPSAFSAQSNKRMPWVCAKGHRWETSVCNRTGRGSKCPYCSGKKAIKGENDLQTLFPELAKQADGWDPSELLPQSNKKVGWKCDLGHRWEASVDSRRNHGCPYCAGNKPLLGFNTFLDRFPEIAKQAEGWDPGTVTYSSKKKQRWKCDLGHTWEAPPYSRQERGCPVCAGKTILQGFNDLLSQFPEVAKEADGWDPATTHAGAHAKKPWVCSEGHKWVAIVKDRTGEGKTCCPFCAEHGFNRDKDAWIYLMERPGEQQIGITNDLETRIKTHQGRGWNLMETVGPIYGDIAYKTERTFKDWLKKEIGTVKGTTENWVTSVMEVRSLADLKARSGVETDLF